MPIGIATCVVYAALCLLGGYLTSTFGFSVILLDGLKQYYVADGDAAAAKQGNDGTKAEAASGNKKKGKKKEEEWTGEGGTKLLSIRVQPIHIVTRPHYKEYNEVAMFIFLGLSILLACDVLHRVVPEPLQDAIDGGDIVALLFGTMSLWRVAKNVGQVQWEKASTKSIDLKICALAGVGGFLLAFLMLMTTPNSYLDFSLEEHIEEAGKIVAAHLNSKLVEGAEPHPPVHIPAVLVKTVIALAAGCLTALLLPAAIRFVSCYHIATSAEGRDLRVLERHWFTRLLLHLSFLLPILTLFLWIKPMASLLLYQPDADSEGKHSADDSNDNSDWAKDLGFSLATFSGLRTAFLVVSSLLHLLCFRINVQSHLNTAVTIWYNTLHRSTELDLNYMKAKLALTIHILSRVAMQCLLPGVIPLILVGLSRARGSHLDAKAVQNGFLFPPSLMREILVFLAWWANSVWALETFLILAGFRLGRLQAA